LEVAFCQVAYWQYSKRLIGGKYCVGLRGQLSHTGQSLAIFFWILLLGGRLVNTVSA
jgi:hypothetical protein